MIKLSNAGDTIVEVLIAMSVITSVLVVAYVTVNKATNNARQAQERGVATKLIETQAERLKAFASTKPIFTSSDFCVDPTGGLPAGPCALEETGNNYTSGVKYNVNVKRTSANDFTITCIWEKAGGGGNDQASLAYRVYP